MKKDLEMHMDDHLCIRTDTATLAFPARILILNFLWSC